MAAFRPHMSSGVTEAAQRVGRLPERPGFVSLGGTTLHVTGAARVYVCGITPYDVTHVGHAATFVWADLLSAVLKDSGVQPVVCRNITDVDDVLTDAARARGHHYDDFALSNEAMFERSMKALQVAAPSDQPRARHYVPAVIRLAQGLLDLGAAYERDGTVWFRGEPVAASTSLGRNEALRLSEQYGDDPADPAKDDPFDVPVWRSSPDGAPAWPSPWGWGRPGWHAECAAMAMALHGASIDVLVGGEDLRFPHHSYQAAMIMAASGVTPFTRATLHVGEVRIDGVKMAKSTGNLVLVDDLLTTWSPAVVRLHLLNRDYGRPWDFVADDLEVTEAQLQRLYAAASRGSRARSDGVHEALRANLDVVTAVNRAEELGGEAARRLISLLRLG